MCRSNVTIEGAMNAQQNFEPGQRSTFVTALAWIFIVLGGFSTLMALGQSVIFYNVVAQPEFQQMIASVETAPKVPAFVILVFSKLSYIFLGVLLVSVANLVSAIGLLLRKNWARLMFIAMMALGIVWNLGGIALQIWMRSWIPSLLVAAPQEEVAPFIAALTMITIISAVIALAFCALFGWIILRLVSPAVKREFGAA